MNILLLPFRLVGMLAMLIVSVMGRMLSLILGVAALALGGALCASILGIVLGAPLCALGAGLMIKAVLF